jgi:hypothetical protein
MVEAHGRAVHLEGDTPGGRFSLPGQVLENEARAFTGKPGNGMEIFVIRGLWTGRQGLPRKHETDHRQDHSGFD